MSAYLARLISGKTYRTFRDIGKQLARHLPKFFEEKAGRAEEFARGFWTGGTLFEELGFYYVVRSTGTTSTICFPSCATCVTLRQAQFSSTWSPRRARVTDRPNHLRTSITAWSNSMSRPERRPNLKPMLHSIQRCLPRA